METTWIKEAVFYHIYPLGFAGAPDFNEGEKTAGNRLLKVINWIPHLKSIGVNAVYFGPIFESIRHGYDTSDYNKIDTRLGSNEDFKKIADALHQAGIRIVLDGVFNHVGRGFFAFEDLKKNGQSSRYINWFESVYFGGGNSYGDSFSYANWGGCEELVKLNLANPEVCDYLLDAVGNWIKDYDIDGLRLDAADCVNLEFFKKLRSFTKSKKEAFWLMGEIIHGDYTRWANADILDSVTNYECWKGLYSSHNDKNYFEIAHSLKRQFGAGGLYKNLTLYNFVDNHDVNRIASLLKRKEDLKNIYALLYLMPGVPSIYYGSEWAISGVKGRGADADKPVRPSLELSKMKEEVPGILDWLKQLSDIRKDSEAIKYGIYEEVYLRNEEYVFARVSTNRYALVAFNISDTTKKLAFKFKGQDYQMKLEPNSTIIEYGEF